MNTFSRITLIGCLLILFSTVNTFAIESMFDCDEAPIISNVPSSVTIECDEEVPAVANVSALDCDGAVVVVDFSEYSSLGHCDNSYEIIRNWTATDAYGNSAIETQVISEHIQE